jgi:hypothetical protein
MNQSRNDHGIVPSVSRRFGCGKNANAMKHLTLVLSLALNAILVILYFAHPTPFPPTRGTEEMKFKTLVETETNHTIAIHSTTGGAESASSHGYVRYPTIIGHVHYAKTAGTEINGELAAHFERICGHKGYSHDAYQFHVRHDKQLAATDKTKNKVTSSSSWKTKFISDAKKANDSIAKNYPTFNRGRVPKEIMFERGFEDCDWISIESPWEFWSEILPDHPIELHVPCRDPIDHLMSQCNHKEIIFDCNATNLQKAVNACLVGWDRFDENLLQDKHLSLKCFDPLPIHPYLDYMGQLLERKRLETDYIHRSTNMPRDKTTECIWELPDLQDQVRRLLRRLDYYRFCAKCMGSKDDLLA